MTKDMKRRTYLTLIFAITISFTVLLVYSIYASVNRRLLHVKFPPINEDDGERELIKYRRSSQYFMSNSNNVTRRVIYAWDNSWAQNYQQYLTNFSGCKYSNCVLDYSSYPDDAKYADVVLVDYYTQKNLDLLKKFSTQDSNFHTVWLLNGHESPGYAHNRWRDFFNDFDGAITYTRDALIARPYGAARPLLNKKTYRNGYYAGNKTKAAFAYVSNCGSMHYDRLKLMMELGKYIDVDIFGECTNNTPCPRGAYACEHELHSQYHFYLSWENSLCKDYITEKFWKVLHGNGYYIPVALGGLTLEEYTAVAPPNSFLHVYNFSSIAELGSYMKMLTKDKEAFSQYNQWRESYGIELDQRKVCTLCEIANFPANFKSNHSNIANQFNDPNRCRAL